MKKSIILMLMACMLALPKTYSQEEYIKTPAKFITKFSFIQLTGGIIIVKALLDDMPDTLNFVLDTGSSGISLDSTTVEDLHLTRKKSDITVKGIGGIRKVDFTYGHTLRLPDLSVEKLDFHINDYDLLSGIYGLKVDGIIGASFFKRYIIKIDYDVLAIEVYSIGYMKYPRGGYMLHPTFQSLPASKQHIKDEKETEGNFIIDCGAGLNMLLSKDFIDEHFNLPKEKKMFSTYTEGVGGKKITNLTVIKSVQFGPYHFKKVPIYIFEDETNITDYPLYGGVLGNDIMRRFNVILNYADGIFYYKPNAHFNDAFDYSYIGFNLYEVDNKVTVMDVIPGSPGYNAGLKTGDVLFGMETEINGVYESQKMPNFEKDIKTGNDKIFSSAQIGNDLKTSSTKFILGTSMQTFKSALQNAGSTLKLIVYRNGQLVEITLKVRHILRRK